MQQFFFYDIPVNITKNLQLWQAYEPYLKKWTSELAISYLPAVKGCIGAKVTQRGFYQLLHSFHHIFTPKPAYVVIYLDSLVSIRETLAAYFQLTYAAGGVVMKAKKVLMIHRLGKWDLPKGKIELGENIEHAAIREVYEECGISAAIKEKLCLTWHNYSQYKINFLKQTTWYTMECLEEKHTRPQTTEGITKVVWMDIMQQQVALKNSYASIGYVLAAHAHGLPMQ